MRLFSLSYLLGWAGTCLSSFFTALNRPGRSLILAFSKTLVVSAGLSGGAASRRWAGRRVADAPAAGVLTAALAVWFLTAVLRQERAQDRQEGRVHPRRETRSHHQKKQVLRSEERRTCFNESRRFTPPGK